VLDDTQLRFQVRRRAETMLDHPPTFPAMGRVRDELHELRHELEQALQHADTDMAELIGRRADLAARIHTCNRALAGTGLLAPHESWAGDRLFWPRAVAYTDPLDESGGRGEPGGRELRELSSAELQVVLVELLQRADRPLTLTDLRRLLAAHRVRPSGPDPSKAMANALRRPVRLGLVERYHRGCYVWSASASTGFGADLGADPGDQDGL